MSNYVVLDLEMCKVPKRERGHYRYSQETIQIGAVLLDEQMNIVDKFITYVKPEYGYIDAFIKKLTGITEQDTADAPNMERALKMFIEWIPEGAKLVSWSESDVRQIRHELDSKKIEIERCEDLLSSCIDSQKLFSEKIHSAKCFNLTEALNLADINYRDGAHDGLVDAYNTALLFAKMTIEEDMQLNPYYKHMLDDEEEGAFTLGSIFEKIDLSAITVA